MSLPSALASLAVATLAGFSSAQTGTLDQFSPYAGTVLGAAPYPFNVWQQEVQAGSSGQLEGFTLELGGGTALINVEVRMGPAWNGSPPVFSAVVTKPGLANHEEVYVDCTSAAILLLPGTLYVIQLQGTGTNFVMYGNHVAPPGTPLYPRRLFFSGTCFNDCGIAIAFKTYVVTPQPATYCTAKLNSLGCLPAIRHLGAPGSPAFTLEAALVRNQKTGLLLYSDSGRAALPFQGGYLCLTGPISRSVALNSGGTPLPANDCSGVYSLDVTAFAQGLLGGSPAPFLLLSGTVIQNQFWGRDAGFPPPNHSTLSNALEYVVP